MFYYRDGGEENHETIPRADGADHGSRFGYRPGHGRAFRQRGGRRRLRRREREGRGRDGGRPSAPQGGEALGLVCDVSKPPSVDETFAKALDRYKRLDVLANVAGVGGFRRLTETTLEDWNRTIGVNLTGTFLICQKAIASHPREQRRHHQRGLGGGAQVAPLQRRLLRVQGGRRHDDQGARRRIRAQGRAHQLRLPGRRRDADDSAVPTAGRGQARGARIASCRSGAWGSPRRSPATIAFLASDDAAYINGSAIVVDGGMIA